MQKKVAEIEKEFAVAAEQEQEQLIGVYQTDNRPGIQKIIKRIRKQMDSLAAERNRLMHMRSYERQYETYSYICGIDEAGRGPLAGPVVAAAVILPKDCEILYLNDSKQVSEKKRAQLFEEIMQKAVATGVGMVSHETIDEINILQATYEAMRQAVKGLKQTPDLLLNDAVIIPELSMKQVSIIKGDAKSVSIAAASILAKVTRDRLMIEYDKKYPGYGFSSNKGYGSPSHIETLKAEGPSPIHRHSFIKNFI